MHKKIEKKVGQTKRISRSTLVKALILFVFIGATICMFRMTPAESFLTPEALGRFLDNSGLLAPLVFIIIFATGICLFIPASILTVLGAALFGAYWGFLYVWIGALAGASGAFFIGRTLGRDFISSIIGSRLKKYNDAIERNGFTAVLYLRLINFPFTPLNFGMGLTKVHFWDYFFGTALGVIAGLFIVSFLGGTLKEMWVSGNWEGLISFKVFLFMALFIFSFFIPKIIKTIKGEK